MALLVASDNGDNTFTLGKLSILLFEDDWYNHDTYAASKTKVWIDDDGDEGGVAGVAGNNIPDFAESLICGDKISKSPYIENTSANDCWAYMVVGVPTLPITQAISSAEAINSLEGTQLTVKVNAYAFQRGLTETEDPVDMWHIYTNGHSTFGSVRTSNERVEMFNVLNIDTESWQFIEQKNTNDNYNWYVYFYKNVLPGKFSGNNLLDESKPYQTTPLFTQVELTGLSTKSYNVRNGNVWTQSSTTTGGQTYNYYSNITADKTQHRLTYIDIPNVDGGIDRIYDDVYLTDKATLHFEIDENNVLQAYIYLADGTVIYTENNGERNIRSGSTVKWKDFDWTSVEFNYSDLWNTSDWGSTGTCMGLFSITQGAYGLGYGLEFTRVKYKGDDYKLTFSHTGSSSTYGYNHNYRITAEGYTDIWNKSYNTYSNGNGWQNCWFGLWMNQCLSTGMLVGNFPWLAT